MENTDDDHGLLHIPEDVFIQILVWLPVISLLRFKSVCKSWRALIESSSFIHLHATTTVTTTSSSNKFGTFIFQASPLCHASYTTETRIFMVTPSRRRSGGGGGGGGEVFEVEDLGVPPLYKTGPTRWRMVGSCNGLICSKYKRLVSLWNPATRQFRLLPKASSSSSLTLEERVWTVVRVVFGFGFDVKTKDYKVIMITTFSLQRKREFRVQVYSLSSNSWRVLEEDIMISLFPKQHAFQGSFDMTTHGLYLNGSFFFEGTYLSEKFGKSPWVFSFDFTNEIFTLIMKHSPDDHAPPYSKLILTYFGADKIAFSSGEGGGGGGRDSVYDIWVLNNEEEHDQEEEEEEEEESYYWTKLQHSIPIRTGYFNWNIPRAISDDGEFALIETRGARDSKLQLFNLVTKEEKTVFSSSKEMLGASVYKPSLVSVLGGGNGNGSSSSSSSS